MADNHESSNNGRWLFQGLVLGLTLLGFALRVYQVGAQSIWADELYSLRYARMGLVDIIRTNIASSDPQAPLYYVLLKLWLLAAGQSEFAVRFVGVVAGAVAIPATARLGASLGHRTAALVAAAFLAVSAYQVWYAQEARTYTLTTALCLVSLLFFTRLLKPPRSSWIYVGLVASTTLAVYSHYYALLLLVAENLLFLLLVRPLRLPIRPWVWAQLALTVPYLPWSGQAIRLIAMHRGEGVPLSSALVLEVFQQYSLGWFLSGLLSEWLWMGFPLLYLVGLAALVLRARRSPPSALPVLVLYILIPLLGAMAFATLTRRPLFAGRYLMLITPALALLLGLGAVSLGRWFRPLGWLAVTFLLISNLAALSQYYDNPHFARPDYRALSQYLVANQQPGDGIVAVGDSVVEALAVYYQGGMPAANLSFRIPPDRFGEELGRMSQNHGRIWLIPYGNTEGDRTAAGWLDEHAYLVDARWFTQTQVRLYTSARVGLQPLLPEPHRFEQGLTLLSVRAGPQPVAVGETLEVEIDLQVAPEQAAGYGLAWRMVDRRGHLLLHGEQALSEGGRNGGDRLRLRRALTIPAPSLPGDHSLLVGLYRISDGKRLALLDRLGNPRGIWATTGEVSLIRRVSEPGRMVAATTGLAHYGDQLELRKADLSPNKVAPGDTLVVALTWAALSAPQSDFTMAVEVAGPDGQVVASQVGSLANSSYPTSRWSAGEVVQDYLDLAISSRAQPGSYLLRLYVLREGTDPGAAMAESQIVGRIEVSGRPRLFALPAVPHPLSYRFGSGFDLLGYNLNGDASRPGEKVRLVLFWRGGAESEKNYTVFAHLLDAENRVVAQHDGPPAGGAAPTSAWSVGEVIEDLHEISIPPDLAAGEYRLEVGLYDPATGERLPVAPGEGGTGENDSLILSTVVRVERRG